jgi:hypothetical protein
MMALTTHQFYNARINPGANKKLWRSPLTSLATQESALVPSQNDGAHLSPV